MRFQIRYKSTECTTQKQCDREKKNTSTERGTWGRGRETRDAGSQGGVVPRQRSWPSAVGEKAAHVSQGHGEGRQRKVSDQK